MTDLASGKGHRDENFPVASFLIAPRHREVVLAFYRVARMADDVADHPTASAAEKLTRLDEIERGLTGADDTVADAVRLRDILASRGLTDRHILDLIEAFRRDVTQNRYADWGELMGYCRYSAAPVGRFVLDVHGESHAAWPASDALCAALQVINHLQDCGEDYRNLDRVYLPTDDLARAGLTVAALGERCAGPALLSVIATLARKVEGLLGEARALGPMVRDVRLFLEIGVIEALARSLNRRLARRDPLAQRVRHRPIEALAVALLGAGRSAGARLFASANP